MVPRLNPIALYLQIGRTYLRWARSLVPLAVIVFIPLGLVHALTVHAKVGSLDFGGGLEIFAVAAALLTLAATGLVGEVFYAGAVTISLTHPHDGRPPSLREIARMIDYRCLIAVDLIYGLLVSAGLVLLVVPGVLAFVYLGLAAPVVEMEHHGVRAALTRSVQLVRGSFWVVLAVLLPIELAGNALITLVTELTQDLLGESLPAEWLADTLSNVAFTPFYAVAAVLITIELIASRDGSGPRLHSAPVSR